MNVYEMAAYEKSPYERKCEMTLIRVKDEVVKRVRSSKRKQPDKEKKKIIEKVAKYLDSLHYNDVTLWFYTVRDVPSVVKAARIAKFEYGNDKFLDELMPLIRP